jgi:acetyl-CoA carboxylase biotin carboxyl carrier protein
MVTGAGGTAKKNTFNVKDLKKLIDLMRKAELTEVDIEQEGVKIKLRKGEVQAAVAGTVAPALVPALAPVAAPAALAPSLSAAAPAPVPADATTQGVTITAPMVGTFYRAAAPDAAPFVQEGAIVEPGKTVCIIEAMKLMNEIKAEMSGKVLKVLVENAQPVEYGQPLFIIGPA